MSNDTISREQLLEEIKRRRNQGIIGKVEAARWKKIVETFPDAPLTEGYVTCAACREKARLYQRARKAGKEARGA